MLRSLCLKSTVLCVAFACLTSVASAQPANDQAPVTDQELHKHFLTLDPSAKVMKETDGSTTYVYATKRSDGSLVNMVAHVYADKVTMTSFLCDPFLPQIPVAEINKNLSENSVDLLPFVMVAHQLDDGRVVFAGVMVIDRSLSFSTFCSQMNYFHKTANSITIKK